MEQCAEVGLPLNAAPWVVATMARLQWPGRGASEIGASGP